MTVPAGPGEQPCALSHAIERCREEDTLRGKCFQDIVEDVGAGFGLITCYPALGDDLEHI